MQTKEQQLMALLGLTARALTDMTASMTTLSFELLRSEDDVTRNAARQMIDRMMTISAGLDEQWRLLAELGGQQAEPDPLLNVAQITAQGPPACLPTERRRLSAGLMPCDSQDASPWRWAPRSAIVLFPRPAGCPEYNRDWP